MSVRCRTASTVSVASDEQSFLTGRQTYREDVRYTNPGLSIPITSDESSIYDAGRASSSIDRYSLTRGSDNPMDEILVGGMAANMAMFVPLDSSPSDSRPQYFSPNQKSKIPWLRPHLLSDNCVPSSNDKDFDTSQRDESAEETSHDDSRHRKVASLNDADDSLRIPKWPGRRMSPVRPAIPRFAPPVRSPTPPGLPSFGTPEAMCYSTQFLVRSFARGGQTQRTNPVPTDAHAASGIGTSYRETLRRLIGLPPPNPPLPTRQSIPVARAEDGTAVLGRFPYRHSGHGMNLARRLDDHPFHRRALPAARCGIAEETARITTQSGPSDTGLPKPRCLGQAEALGSCTHPVPEAHTQGSSNVGSSVPSPAVTPRSRNARIAMLFRPKAPSANQTSAVQSQNSQTPMNNNGSCVQSLGRADGPHRSDDGPSQSVDIACSQDLSGTTSESAASWFQYLKSNTSSMCCCLGTNNEQDDIIYSHSSNDTYTTARSWVDNGDAAGGAFAHAHRVCQARLGQWCSNMWIAIHGFAFGRNTTTMPPPA